MSTNVLTPEQTALVHQAASVQGLKEYKININPGSSKGDNYLGIIHSLAVEGNEASLFLILKTAHTSEEVRKANPIPQAFQREAFIYSIVIPRLQQIQEQYAISSPFTGVAQYYGSCLDLHKESILLQNLKECGYRLWDRKKPMDDAHIGLVFSEYARFHAASLAWRFHYPEEFSSLTKNMHQNVVEANNPGSRERKKEKLNGYFQVGRAATQGNAKASAGIEKLRSEIAQLIERSHFLGRDRFVVLHGDCWCNNMLFKYHDNQPNSPSQVCFIDWQISKLGSPILDLAYFFSVCAPKELFANLHKYLAAYHQTMAKNLREFGCRPDEIFSWTQLLEDWNRNAWYGVFLAMMIIKLMLSDAEEAPAMNADADIISSLTNFSSRKEAEFEKRLCDLVEFMVDHNYI
ncbi:uncharacterized protein LOC109534047 [Dendroctonus ponderosae]|uniref:CHK kinase-like domain-containing protein n=1 Tax=Dendroctonus ponderosae TaxID=77166 RepID=J3JW51_DENPD